MNNPIDATLEHISTHAADLGAPNALIRVGQNGPLVACRPIIDENDQVLALIPTDERFELWADYDDKLYYRLREGMEHAP